MNIFLSPLQFPEVKKKKSKKKTPHHTKEIKWFGKKIPLSYINRCINITKF